MTKDIVIKEELNQNISNAVETANQMVVVDNDTNVTATNFLKILKSFQSEIKAEMRPGITLAYETHKHLVSQEKRLLAPLQTAEKAIKGKVSAFLLMMEAKRQEEQRKVREKAEAAERKRKEELEAQAKKWEEKGNAEKAEERRQQAEETFVPVPTVVTTVEPQKGVASIKTWKFEVVKEELVPDEWKIVDEAAIGKVVRSFKDKAKVEKMIPGIRVWSESSVSVRA